MDFIHNKKILIAITLGVVVVFLGIYFTLQQETWAIDAKTAQVREAIHVGEFELALALTDELIVQKGKKAQSQGYLLKAETLLEKNIQEFTLTTSKQPIESALHATVSFGNRNEEAYKLFAKLYTYVLEYDKALSYLDLLIELEPRNVDLLIEKGNLLSQQSKLVEATGAYEAALSMDPKNVEVQTNLLNLYFAAGNNAQTKEFADTLIADDMDTAADTVAYEKLAYLAGFEGDAVKFKEYADKAISSSGNNLNFTMLFMEFELGAFASFEDAMWVSTFANRIEEIIEQDAHLLSARLLKHRLYTEAANSAEGYVEMRDRAKQEAILAIQQDTEKSQLEKQNMINFLNIDPYALTTPEEMLKNINAAFGITPPVRP